MVVSTARWAPSEIGRQFALTSMRRSSGVWMQKVQYHRRRAARVHAKSTFVFFHLALGDAGMGGRSRKNRLQLDGRKS